MTDILFVDDNYPDFVLFEHLLNKLFPQLNYLWMKSGEEARDFLFCKAKYKNRNIKEQPRLLLVDLNLPQLSGLELLELLQTHPLAQELSIAVHSISTNPNDIENSYTLGANFYLYKEVEMDPYLETLEGFIGFYFRQELTKNGRI